MTSLLNSFVSFLLNVLSVLFNILTYPLSVLIDIIFPSFANLITIFTNGVNTYFFPYFGYFLNILPPLFRTCLITALLFYVTYYSFYLLLLSLSWVFNMFQKIKFW